jgi:hypothetical protein
MFAFSHKEFKNENSTSVFKAAVDAFNIFDLFPEVWRAAKWFFLAVILRRPYVRQAGDEKFDVHGAFSGNRDVAPGYGEVDSHPMLDIPDRGRATHDALLDEERGIPTSLRAGGNKFRDKPSDVKMVENTKPEGSDFPPPPEYSNSFGEEKK